MAGRRVAMVLVPLLVIIPAVTTALRAELLGAPVSPVGGLVQFGWPFVPVAAASVAIELGAPLALVRKSVRNVWVAATWLMHVSIAVLMYTVFPYPWFAVAFAPFFDLEVGVRVLRERPWRRHSVRQRRSRHGIVPASIEHAPRSADGG